MSSEKPPVWAVKLLRLFIRKEYLEEIEGDLEEVFYDDMEYMSPSKARKGFILGVFKLVRLNLLKKITWFYKIEFLIMTVRNFKIAYRNLLRFKTHSIINLLGLSLGLTAGTLIFFYVLQELSFDNFHEKKERIYKVVTASGDGGMETNAQPIGHKLRTEFPEVESVAYLRHSTGMVKMHFENEKIDQKIHFASPEFFDIFSFNVLAGDAKKALEDPYSTVITKEVNDIYFKGNGLGNTIQLGDTLEMKIGAIVDNLPTNSHIQFDVLVSFSTLGKMRYFSYIEGWGNFDIKNYILLKEGVDHAAFQEKAASIYNDNIGEWLEEMGVSFSSAFIPLKDVYLHPDYWNSMGAKGSLERVKTVSIIAIFLLVLACINYINLSTARFSERSKEVGMRKILGSNRSAVIYQFMTESFVLTIFAFLFSVIQIYYFLPTFNDLLNKSYQFSSFLSLEAVMIVGGLILTITILSGFYPALLVSRFNPLEILNKKLKTNTKGLTLRKLLISFQFFISAGLVVATLIVYNQLSFMTSQDLGFDKEQILVLDTKDVNSTQLQLALQNKMRSMTGVQSVSFSNALPGRPGWQGQWAYPEVMEGKQVDTEYMAIDESYINVLGLELIAGSNFDKSKPDQLKNGLIINESCVKAMGWESPEAAIGKEIVSPSSRPAGTVIGVVKDYHGLGLQNEIWPKCMDYDQQYARFVSIKYDAAQTYEILKKAETEWNKIIKGDKFDYFFLDEDFERQYNEERQLANVLIIFAVVIIIVSAIGLLGLISFIALSRTKEVGIRKALGANVANINLILMKEYIVPVIGGNLAVIPLVWYFGNDWLNNFAYHTSINPLIFLFGFLLTASIAFITVSIQTIKIAKLDPVKALRYE